MSELDIVSIDGKNLAVKKSYACLDYELAVGDMDCIVSDIIAGYKGLNGVIWLLEHQPVYTCGIMENVPQDYINGIPVLKSKRGGKITYHGPGQRVVYIMLDIRKFYSSVDIRELIAAIEDFVAYSLLDIGISSVKSVQHPGIWTPDRKKIASIGLKVRKGVSYHGVAINIANDLSCFKHIHPCGVPDMEMTSVSEQLNRSMNVRCLDQYLIANIERLWRRS